MPEKKARTRAVRTSVPYMTLLSPSDIERIHDASMRLLSETGVRVDDQYTLELLKSGGARVTDGRTAHLNEEMLNRALKTAPKSIAVGDRDGNPALVLEDGYSYFGGGSDTIVSLDPYSGGRKPTSLATVGEFARVMDGLAQYDFVMSMGSGIEIKSGIRDQMNFLMMMENSTKPIVFTAQTEPAMRAIAGMCTATRGSAKAFSENPFAILYAMPTAPLIHTYEAIKCVLIAADTGIPCIYASAPMKGATGPITTAGMLVLSNAETLSGLIIHQLQNPGAPYIYGATLGPLEMKSMVNIYNGPESMHMQTGSIQLGRHYGLPSFATAGCSDSKRFDAQAAAECSMSLLNAALSGGVVVHDVGYLESGLCSSMEMAVLADEIISQLRFYLKGAAFDDEALLLGDIKRAGIGGSYLELDSTMDHFRGEVWYPELIDHNNHDSGKAMGAQDMNARIRARVDDLLTGHHPAALEKTLHEMLLRIAHGRG